MNNDMKSIDTQIQTQVEKLKTAISGMADASRKGINPDHTPHATSKAFCLHWLKALHIQRLETMRAMPKAKLPTVPFRG